MNKSLLTGLDLLQSLTHLQLRFRQHQFACVYRCRAYAPPGCVPDCDLHHCAFCGGRINIVVYQDARQVLLAKDLFSCAKYALQRAARDNIGQYSEATKAGLKAFYMDKYLQLVESPERALHRSKELVHIRHLSGFKLTKFVSNAPNLAD